MQHRLIGNTITGLGGNAKTILDNSGQMTPKIKEMFNEAIEIFSLMKKWECLDFEINENVIKFGIEPTYQYDKLEIVCVANHLANCYIETGIAFGVYGIGIRKKRKYYYDFKQKTKFTDFINKWQPQLFTNEPPITQ